MLTVPILEGRKLRLQAGRWHSQAWSLSSFPHRNRDRAGGSFPKDPLSAAGPEALLLLHPLTQEPKHLLTFIC